MKKNRRLQKNTIMNFKKKFFFILLKKFYMFDQFGAEPPPQLELAAPVAGVAFHSSA